MHLRTRSHYARVRSFFGEYVAVDRCSEYQLYALSFCIGVQDGATVPDFRVFASNQTGNTIFLGISVLPARDKTLFDPRHAAVSLALFVLGTFITAQLGHLIGPRRRSWLVLSNFYSTALVCAAAGLTSWWREASGLVIIGLLAFAAGAQVVLSRTFDRPEISTVMATAAWVDILVDRDWRVRHNPLRNRRLCFLASLWIGAVVGYAIYCHVSSNWTLAAAGIGKAMVTTSYCVNRVEEEDTGAQDADLPVCREA